MTNRGSGTITFFTFIVSASTLSATLICQLAYRARACTFSTWITVCLAWLVTTILSLSTVSDENGSIPLVAVFVIGRCKTKWYLSLANICPIFTVVIVKNFKFMLRAHLTVFVVNIVPRLILYTKRASRIMQAFAVATSL